MSWSRFILQRGFDCHARVIDCPKDRGKSRNVITASAQVAPTARQSMRSKKSYRLAHGKGKKKKKKKKQKKKLQLETVGSERHGESGPDVQTCQRHLGIRASPAQIVLHLGYSQRAPDTAAVSRLTPACPRTPELINDRNVTATGINVDVALMKCQYWYQKSTYRGRLRRLNQTAVAFQQDYSDAVLSPLSQQNLVSLKL